MKSYLLSLFTEDVLSVYKKYSQFLWSSSSQPFPPRVYFQLSSIRLRVTQSKMAQKFESASKLAYPRWKFVVNNSVIVTSFSNLEFKESKTNHLMHNVFCIRYSDYCIYSFIFSSRNAKAHNILLSELLIFVCNGTLKLQL